jgi:glycosyltransferase involved in cell wall biosynthesis
MKLLVVTSEYPNPRSDYDTPVVHYFVKEWMALGHEVRVYHSRSVFPRIFYPAARMMKSAVKKFFKTDFIPQERLDEPRAFRHEGVEIVSMPVFKVFPHVRFFSRTITKLARAIFDRNSQAGFTPDVIICHFVDPPLPLIAELKRLYPRAKASLVVHEDPRVIAQRYGNGARALLEKVDFIGFRFEEMKARYVVAQGPRSGLFLCPSGVPDEFIRERVPEGRFGSGALTICFTGMLIPLKNVDVLIDAVSAAFPDRDFRLVIAGKGFLEESLRARAAGLGRCVEFVGHLPRQEIQRLFEATDIFVMVSKPEAFGLVYLEAMAKGCVVVGTRGQGIDGVIQHGVNGFLCGARDVSELRDLLRGIREMPVEERGLISERALATAREYSDAKVAADYLVRIGIKREERR